MAMRLSLTRHSVQNGEEDKQAGHRKPHEDRVRRSLADWKGVVDRQFNN